MPPIALALGSNLGNRAAHLDWAVSRLRAFIDGLVVSPYVETARPLDIDRILYGEMTIDEPGLSVPHPRFRERAFVLEPLAALAPSMIDPVTGRTIAQLAAALES